MKAGRLNAQQRIDRVALHSQIENVIRTCPNLTYPKLSLMLNVSISTVEKVAKLKGCQRVRGGKKQAV